MAVLTGGDGIITAGQEGGRSLKISEGEVVTGG
jgi:hypothetical protein